MYIPAALVTRVRQRVLTTPAPWKPVQRTSSGTIWFRLNRPGNSPLMPDEVSEHFRQLSDAAGLPPIPLHDLRHGAATYALTAGVPAEVVSYMLGHSDVAFTQNTYTSMVTDTRRAGAEAIAVVINASR